jgi:hypothetical protein
VSALDANQTGAPTNYDYYTVTVPVGAGKDFFRIEGVENCRSTPVALMMRPAWISTPGVVVSGNVGDTRSWRGC